MKVCSKCKGKPQPLSEFNKNATRKDGHQTYCRTCGKKNSKRYYKANAPRMRKQIVATNKERAHTNRALIVDYLSTHPCVDCGEDDVVVLDFDHVRGTKRLSVSRMQSYSWETIKEEIEKCDVRCANCHRRKSAKQLGHYRATIIPGRSYGWTAVSDTAQEGSTPSPGTKRITAL